MTVASLWLPIPPPPLLDFPSLLDEASRGCAAWVQRVAISTSSAGCPPAAHTWEGRIADRDCTGGSDARSICQGQDVHSGRLRRNEQTSRSCRAVDCSGYMRLGLPVRHSASDHRLKRFPTVLNLCFKTRSFGPTPQWQEAGAANASMNHPLS